jgi:hypothetical protein
MTTRKRKPAGTMGQVDKLLSYAVEQFSLAQSSVRGITMRATTSGAEGRVVTVDADNVAVVYRLSMNEHGECMCRKELADD